MYLSSEVASGMTSMDDNQFADTHLVFALIDGSGRCFAPFSFRAASAPLNTIQKGIACDK